MQETCQSFQSRSRVGSAGERWGGGRRDGKGSKGRGENEHLGNEERKKRVARDQETVTQVFNRGSNGRGNNGDKSLSDQSKEGG